MTVLPRQPRSTTHLAVRATSTATLTAAMTVAITVALGLGAGLANAALKPGDKAPDFSTEAALGGDSFKFSLGDALKKGPVVLYFYPKAFTSGCTVEAHNFAEASDEFKKMGATLIGMSNDDIATLKKFSVEACRNKFAVAADPGARLAKQYDATLAIIPGVADRITYVINTDGRVAYTYASMSPDGHVESALKAVAGLKR